MSVRCLLKRLIVCAVALSLLTGCITTIAPARPLLGAGNAHALRVRVAVQANGIKHYAWIECAHIDCQIVYQRLLMGAVSYQHFFPVGIIRNLDLAVTADGRAFLIYTTCESNCLDYYSIIPPDATENTPITAELLTAPGGSNGGQPIIEARDNIVYAAYFWDDFHSSRLRYRQLSGGTSSGFMELRSSVVPREPALAIGGDGALHATWLAYTGSSDEIVYGTNSGSTGDFGAPTIYPEAATSLGNPDIALDPSTTPYIVYKYDGGSSDIVKIRCNAAVDSCFGGITERTITLASAQDPWRLRGNPQIQVLGSVPNVVFSADNSATTNNEIWYYSPPSSGIDPGPLRATDNAVDDDEPLFVKERSTYGDVGVAAWRTYVTFVIPPSPSFGGSTYDCLGDVYTFYFTTTTVRRVFDTTGGCRNPSLDLAANGPWVAGVWLDYQTSSQQDRLIPWTAFNAHTTHAPMITQ